MQEEISADQEEISADHVFIMPLSCIDNAFEQKLTQTAAALSNNTVGLQAPLT